MVLHTGCALDDMCPDSPGTTTPRWHNYYDTATVFGPGGPLNIQLNVTSLPTPTPTSTPSPGTTVYTFQTYTGCCVDSYCSSAATAALSALLALAVVFLTF